MQGNSREALIHVDSEPTTKWWGPTPNDQALTMGTLLTSRYMFDATLHYPTELVILILITSISNAQERAGIPAITSLFHIHSIKPSYHNSSIFIAHDLLWGPSWAFIAVIGKINIPGHNWSQDFNVHKQRWKDCRWYWEVEGWSIPGINFASRERVSKPLIGLVTR